jgi:hypothetical protein
MISASALAPNCGYAKVLSNLRPRPPSTVEAADRGTAFHAAVEKWIKSGEMPTVDDLEIQGWLDLLASQFTPPPGAEVEIAWGLRKDNGGYAEVDEPEPHKYVARNGCELLTAGRADLAWMRRDCVYVVDWKTGRWPATAAIGNLQVNAAGLALARGYGAISYVPGIYYVRDGAWDWGDPVSGKLETEMLAAVREAALLPPEPRPGSWCARCWERKQCKAAQ